MHFQANGFTKEVEALFREASEPEDMDLFYKCYDRLLEQGVKLLDVENDIEIKYFTMHIDGNKVNLRYAEPPYVNE